MSPESLEDLLRACVVRVEGGPRPGAGFFVAPGRILTCVHVVGDASDISVWWPASDKAARLPATRIERFRNQPRPIPALAEDYPDVALVTLNFLDHPCVALEPNWPLMTDRFQTYGFPIEGGAVDLTPAVMTYRGKKGRDPLVFIDLASDTIKAGMSGAPLLNLRSGRICGVLVATRNPAVPDGGFAVPWEFLDHQLMGVSADNRAFHQLDGRWARAQERLTQAGNIGLPQAGPVRDAVPLPPDDLVHRRLLGPVVAALLGVTPAPGRQVTLRGPGGFGKTVLAQAACAHPQVRERFRDGILWMTLGNRPDLTAHLVYASSQITGDRRPAISAEDAEHRFARAIEHQQLLLVVDDVWDRGDLAPLLVGGAGVTRLITTRQRLGDRSSVEIYVGELEPDEGLRFLEIESGTGRLFAGELNRLVAKLGRWPLLLRLIARVLSEWTQDGATFEDAIVDVTARLEDAGVVGLDELAETVLEPSLAVSRTLELSLGLLDDSQQALLEDLAILRDEPATELSVASALWNESPSRTRAFLTRFDGLSLLEFNQRTLVFSVHTVVRAYLRQRHPQPSAVHRRLCSLWNDPFSLVSGKDRYPLAYLSWHLAEGGASVDLRVLTGKAWRDHRRRVEQTDLAFLRDVQEAAEAFRRAPYVDDLAATKAIELNFQITDGRLPIELVNLLVQLGRRDQATAYVDLVSEPAYRAELRVALCANEPPSASVDAALNALDSLDSDWIRLNLTLRLAETVGPGSVLDAETTLRNTWNASASLHSEEERQAVRGRCLLTAVRLGLLSVVELELEATLAQLSLHRAHQNLRDHLAAEYFCALATTDGYRPGFLLDWSVDTENLRQGTMLLAVANNEDMFSDLAVLVARTRDPRTISSLGATLAEAAFELAKQGTLSPADALLSLSLTYLETLHAQGLASEELVRSAGLTAGLLDESSSRDRFRSLANEKELDYLDVGEAVRYAAAGDVERAQLILETLGDRVISRQRAVDDGDDWLIIFRGAVTAGLVEVAELAVGHIRSLRVLLECLKVAQSEHNEAVGGGAALRAALAIVLAIDDAESRSWLLTRLLGLTRRRDEVELCLSAVLEASAAIGSSWRRSRVLALAGGAAVSTNADGAAHELADAGLAAIREIEKPPEFAAGLARIGALLAQDDRHRDYGSALISSALSLANDLPDADEAGKAITDVTGLEYGLLVSPRLWRGATALRGGARTEAFAVVFEAALSAKLADVAQGALAAVPHESDRRLVLRHAAVIGGNDGLLLSLARDTRFSLGPVCHADLLLAVARRRVEEDPLDSSLLDHIGSVIADIGSPTDRAVLAAELTALFVTAGRSREAAEMARECSDAAAAGWLSIDQCEILERSALIVGGGEQFDLALQLAGGIMIPKIAPRVLAALASNGPVTSSNLRFRIRLLEDAYAAASSLADRSDRDIALVQCLNSSLRLNLVALAEDIVSVVSDRAEACALLAPTLSGDLIVSDAHRWVTSLFSGVASTLSSPLERSEILLNLAILLARSGSQVRSQVIVGDAVPALRSAGGGVDDLWAAAAIASAYSSVLAGTQECLSEIRDPWFRGLTGLKCWTILKQGTAIYEGILDLVLAASESCNHPGRRDRLLSAVAVRHAEDANLEASASSLSRVLSISLRNAALRAILCQTSGRSPDFHLNQVHSSRTLSELWSCLPELVEVDVDIYADLIRKVLDADAWSSVCAQESEI